MGGGSLFYDFFAPPIGFQAHSFLPRPLELVKGGGVRHLYRCLGIKDPWPLLLRGGLGQPWLCRG